MTDANRQISRQSTLADQGKDADASLDGVPDAFVELAANAVRSGECYEQRRMVGSWKDTTAEDVQFEVCRFSAIDLSKTQWRQMQLRCTQLEKCDLANAR